MNLETYKELPFEEQKKIYHELKDKKSKFMEEMVVRCEEDVKINYLLWKQQQAELMELYERDSKEVVRIIDYISFKLDCLVEQSENKVPLDIELICEEIVRLDKLVVEKREPLKNAMPKIPIKAKRNRPKVMHKADGSLSVAGENWIKICSENLLDFQSETIEYIVDYEEPNPDSPVQVKDWLDSLGWTPAFFKFQRDKKTNTVKQIPQIKSEYDSTDICDSVKELIEIEPAIEYLASYSTIKHRLAVIKGFVRDMDSDFKLEGAASGMTNTFRLKHKTIVNLPKPSAPYAENIRACLIAGEDSYMVGADLSAVEDLCKQSYIYPLDPEYVNSMRAEGFDPHLDIAVRAKLLTEEQVEAHVKGEANYKEERSKAKTVNFAATYGVGVKTLARNMKVKDKEAKIVLDAYWERNWSLKNFAESCITKTVNGQMWVQQPVSKFWYTLRSAKDIFSTVNQSTAVYVFDTWCKYVRQLGLKISFSIHDEICLIVNNSTPKEKIKKIILKAMELTNEELKMNVPMGCSLDYGNNYCEVH